MPKSHRARDNGIRTQSTLAPCSVFRCTMPTAPRGTMVAYLSGVEITLHVDSAGKYRAVRHGSNSPTRWSVSPPATRPIAINIGLGMYTGCGGGEGADSYDIFCTWYLLDVPSSLLSDISRIRSAGQLPETAKMFPVRNRATPKTLKTSFVHCFHPFHAQKLRGKNRMGVNRRVNTRVQTEGSTAVCAIKTSGSRW